MELVPGQRLSNGRHNCYVVGQCLRATDWDRLYAARKVFYNYRYEERELYEAAQDEWVDVLVRVCEQPVSVSGPDGAAQWDRLRYEATQVLAAMPSWFPQPLDLFESTAQQQAAGNGDGVRSLLLVTSSPHCQSLARWRQTLPADTLLPIRAALEILDFLDSLHRRKQVIGAVSPDDFVIDESGRLCCMVGDRVMPAKWAAALRPLFPPDRYPRSYRAPEIRDPQGRINRRSDLFSWAALGLSLIANIELPDAATEPDSDFARITEAALEQLESTLERMAQRDASSFRSLSLSQKPRPQQRIVRGWSAAISQCLQVDPARRPKSVSEVRRAADAWPTAIPIDRIWKHLTGSRARSTHVRQADG